MIIMMQEHAKIEAKSIIMTILFALILGGFFILARVIAPPEVSQSERRPLEKMPEFTLNTVISGEFMAGFEKYAADSFPFREEFRAVKAHSVFNIFFMSDKSGLYIGKTSEGELLAGKFEPINHESMTEAAKKIRKVAESIKSEADVNIYYSVIPDKSIYMKQNYPGFDPDEANAILSAELGNLAFIDLVPALTLDMFYRTDVHWDQPHIGAAVTALTNTMGATASSDFETNIAGEFSGVYTGQLAMHIKNDLVAYSTNDILKNAEVRILDERTLEFKPGNMYDMEGFESNDPYNFFLGGPQPLIEIVNPAAENERTLYIFRDSFGSSIAPLLVPSYAKVTLIDLRYLDSRLLSEFVEFEDGDDILFLYSSQILNSSSVLLVKLD